MKGLWRAYAVQTEGGVKCYPFAVGSVRLGASRSYLRRDADGPVLVCETSPNAYVPPTDGHESWLTPSAAVEALKERLSMPDGKRNG